MFKRTTMLALARLALVFATPLLGACLTTAGAGADISDAGQAIQHDANHDTLDRAIGLDPPPA
jgi:predicted small secreted protein